ncbi:MAG: hypothetical protein GH155_03630 [Spirochaeta sp.]|nr:hypothetical protein [Spirochaeta sp.]
MEKRYKNLFFLSLFLFLPLCLTPALDSYTVEGGLQFLINSDQDSAPSPLMPTLGFSRPFWKRGIFTLDGGALFFGTYYQYQNDRALPAEIEHRDFLVLASLVDARIGPEFIINNRLKAGGGLGLALFIRLPIPLFDDIKDDFTPLLGYFYAGRFVYPETEIYTAWKLNDKLELKTSIRVLFPIFHLWDGEELPFVDQMLISGLIGIRYTLP